MDPKEIEIDYDRIDVARIMDQIKEKTAPNPQSAGLVRDGADWPLRSQESPAGPGRMRQVF